MSSSHSWTQIFQWLMKPKFYTKCKSYVKFINMRLEIIQKKRKAVQKFMKSDIVELLKNDHDYDAYRKAAGFLFEQKLLYCYELIAKFIECISDHLEELSKNGDCPDECKEAIPSLMYAAARFADLPELRDIRTLFREKFENSLEPYISKEFVEKLRRDPPTREMKINLLYDIAQEFSIEWDDKALEKTLYAQSLNGERPKVDKTDNLVSLRKHKDESDYNKSKGKERNTISQGKKDFNDEIWSQHSSSEDEASTDMSSMDGKKSSSISLGSTSDDEVEIKRPSSYWLIPPPYLKQNTTNEGGTISDKEKNDPSQQPEYDTGQNRKGKRSYIRGTSLPTEPTNAVETSTWHARKMSLDQELKVGRGRVHPNLPEDYDDLAARVAALRGR
ncbi:putative vacuolar protein sorting-associated protein Ist1 [Lupinus albus]|uniref:Putative vacuolar protein sorting-associated protein Ist1 n=1 Tax=Lupinus albus TaxID=3870 RepID=A0A6A4NBC7_LUPAL|nr:putative vacuolar protein sorting-associated protein Ist1 [Lupinus albus]